MVWRDRGGRRRGALLLATASFDIRSAKYGIRETKKKRRDLATAGVDERDELQRAETDRAAPGGAGMIGMLTSKQGEAQGP